MTTILLADHDPKVRSAMRLLLEQQPQCSQIVELESSDGLVEKALEHQVKIVILEWELPGVTTNAQLITQLRKEIENVKIVSISGRERVGQLAMALGASAFINKSDSPDKLLDCVQKCCGDHAAEGGA